MTITSQDTCDALNFVLNLKDVQDNLQYYPAWYDALRDLLGEIQSHVLIKKPASNWIWAYNARSSREFENYAYTQDDDRYRAYYCHFGWVPELNGFDLTDHEFDTAEEAKKMCEAHWDQRDYQP